MSYIDCPTCGCMSERELDCRKKDCICHKRDMPNTDYVKDGVYVILVPEGRPQARFFTEDLSRMLCCVLIDGYGPSGPLPVQPLIETGCGPFTLEQIDLLITKALPMAVEWAKKNFGKREESEKATRDISIEIDQDPEGAWGPKGF